MEKRKMMVRMLCDGCAEKYKESFALRPMIRRKITKSCEMCGKREKLLLYEAERKRDADCHGSLRTASQ